MMKGLLIACLMIAAASAQLSDIESGCQQMRSYNPCTSNDFTFAADFPDPGDCTVIIQYGFKHCTFPNYARHCHENAFEFHYDGDTRRCIPAPNRN